MNQYEQIGAITWINNVPYFHFGQSSDGFIFKDAEAYEKNWDDPCYVPEYAAEDAAITINGIEYECGGDKTCCHWYSHNDLLAICHGNKKLCDYMFESLSWSFPNTWLDDAEKHGLDYNHLWDFVRDGNRVWWNDPDQELNGWYDVICTPPPSNYDDWDEDTEISISSRDNEICAHLIDLTDYEYKQKFITD